MDRAVAETAIKSFLKEISDRLDKAGSIGRAAKVCAEEGNVAKAVEIVLDVEQLAYESNNLLNAASMLNRISGE
jgi:hypothetical protein